MRPPVTRSRWRALPRSLVAVRDAHRLCYAPTRSGGAMIGASLSKSVTKHIHTSTIFVDALRAAPRSIHGLERDTRGARKRVRAPRLIYSALPIVPGRRVRGEGAAPTVRWCCPRTRSMARLQRLQLSAAVSSVKNGAAICPDRPAACSAPPTESALTTVLRETRGVTPTTRRARSSLASETHTKRNAPRRRLAPKVTHTPRRLPRRLPRLRQG